MYLKIDNLTFCLNCTALYAQQLWPRNIPRVDNGETFKSIN